MMGNASQPAAAPGCSRWLAAIAGILAIFETGAAIRSLSIAPGLAAQVSLFIPLEFAASVAWVWLSAFVTYTVLRGKPRAVQYAAWLLIGWGIYHLARLAIFVQADYDRLRLPFIGVAAFIAFIVPSAFILRPTRVAAQPTENPGNGRKPED
jgi:hypothetical protein